jgi:hypothetical protein
MLFFKYACVLGALVLPALAQESTAPTAKEIEISGSRPWTDTAIDLEAGDMLRITATGTVTSNANSFSPEGGQRSWRDLVRTYPLNEASRGALIGRVGETRPFLIGPRRESRVPVGGRLFIGVNLPAGETAEGNFRVTVERVPADPAQKQAIAALVEKLARLTQAQLNGIPTRVVDDQGTQGDRVNFLIVGSEEKVRGALQAAGWTIVDKNVQSTIIAGALASLQRQAYVTMPMSELKMFGRSQDYGYAQGDPLKVVASRHHFRIWRAPFTVDDRPVWVGAGTHDIGFDKDQRNGKVTHRIDPEVDKERDYIGQTLNNTGEVALLDYMTPKEPIRKAKTAHGEEFFSDGRTLIIYLLPENQAPAKIIF